jgi:hypothetical protein
VALDRQVAGQPRDRAFDGDLGRLEADLRVLLAVEELRRLEVRREVLVLDDDAVDRNGPDQAGAAVLVDGELGAQRGEAAAERREHVLDGETGRGVDGIGRVGTGRDGRGDGGHVVLLPLIRWTGLRSGYRP